ncbi:MAG: MFS transporter [Ilumatobacter sp.]|nr:MFS transporter [Ilumatobacter sp.]
MHEATRHTGASPRPVLPLVFVTTLTSIMGNSLLAPLIPDILDTFDRPDSSAGLLVAAASLPGIVMAPVIGLLADRFGRRPVLTPCLLTFGVAGILVATAPTFEIMLLARFCLGLGAAGLVNLAVVLLTDRFDGDDRTRWIGVNSGVLTVALATFPVVSGAIAAVAGWRWALAPLSLGIVAAGFAWRTLPAGRPASPVSLREQLAGARLAFSNRAIGASVFAAAISFAVIFGVFLAALPTHLDDEFGLSAWGRGVVFGLPAVTSSIAAFNLGRLRRRFRADTVVLVAAAAWTSSFLLMGLAGSLVVLGLGALVYGIAEGALIPTLQDAAMSRAPADQRAAVMAGWTAMARAGQTTGPLVAGALLAGPGSGAALLSGAVGAGLLVVVFSTRPFGRDVGDATPSKNHSS